MGAGFWNFALLRKSITLVALLLAVGFGVTTNLHAQGVGSVSGRVVDSSGSAVPAAKITVRNTETNESRTTSSEDSGAYRVLSLQVGKYEVKVEKEGFKEELRSGVTLVIGQEAVVDVSLEVGNLTQSVTITAEAPVVNTTTAATSGLVGEQEVKDLPLNGRSYDNLVTLNSGTVNVTALHPTASTAGGGFGNIFSLAGRRVDQNIYLLNGVEYAGNGVDDTSPGSVSGQLLGIDAVREFNLVSNDYGAEYGKRAGGQISIVTMSGTNTLHGSVFEFLRNSDLDARNYFDTPVSILGARIPHFERNNFGGSLGGPIRKDKTFLFGNFEGLRQLLGLSNDAIVPDNSARQGLLPCGVLNTVPAGCTPTSPLVHVTLAPGVVPYLAIWPIANGAEVLGPGGAPSGSANYFNSALEHITENYGNARIDQVFSARDTLSGVYTVDDGLSYIPQVTNTFITGLYIRSQLVSGSWVHVFSPNFLNTFTAGFDRATYYTFPVAVTNIPSNLSFVQGLPLGAIDIGASAGVSGGALSVIGAANPGGSSRNLFIWKDDAQITKGKHLLSFGVWFNRLQDNENQATNAGIVTIANIQNLLAGVEQTFQAVPFPVPLGDRVFMGAWYAQDVIKLKPNLTFSLGVRHEFTNGWSESDGRISNFLRDSSGVIQSTPTIGGNLFPQNNALFLFEPRLGLAWDVFGNGKTAVHAGFGTYHNLIDDLTNKLTKDPPFNTTIRTTTPGFPFTQITPQNLATIPDAQFTPNIIPPNMKTPSTVAYDLKIEQQLTSSMSLAVGYDGYHSYHEQVLEDSNQPIPVVCGVTGNCTNLPGLIVTAPSQLTTLPTGTLYFASGLPRQNTVIGDSKCVCDIGQGNYNALVVEVVQRVKYGLTLKTNYTWSKVMDDGSALEVYGAGASNVMNPRNILQDWAPTFFNVGHRFSFTGSYSLPIGKGMALGRNVTGVADKLISNWQLNTIMTFEDGLPIDPLLGFNQSRDQNANDPDRPSINPSFTGPLYTGNPNQWYNPNAFILSPLGTYGNASRNMLIGPGLEDVDISLFKTVSISERFNLQFRAETFNAFNRVNFGPPNATVLNTNGTPRATAGDITSTATNSRQVQFGLKVIW